MRSLNSPTRRAALRALTAGAGLSVAALALHAPAALAQNYPDKPVRIVVGFTPGGTNDIVARLIASGLQEQLKESFVVDNKPGANSAIGNDFVAKAKPDGYTLLVSSSGGLTTNPVLMKSLAYDPAKDYEPIALLGTFPLVVVVSPSLPVKNMAEFVQYAKKSPGGIVNHGTPTTSFQLVAESFAAVSGIKFEHITYRGSGMVTAAIMGNEIPVAFIDSAAVTSHIKGGKLKALAVTTAKRSSALPDVPTIAESGFAGFEAPIWTALMAPKGTPAPVLAKLRSTVAEILKQPATIERFHALGMDPGDADYVSLGKRINSDIARWTKVAKDANIQPQ